MKLVIFSAVVSKCFDTCCYVFVQGPSFNPYVALGIMHVRITRKFVTSFILLFVACMPLNNAVESQFIYIVSIYLVS